MTRSVQDFQSEDLAQMVDVVEVKMRSSGFGQPRWVTAVSLALLLHSSNSLLHATNTTIAYTQTRVGRIQIKRMHAGGFVRLYRAHEVHNS